MILRAALGRSLLGLTVYSLCVVFVFSFILFEVLDVDGSDFPVVATQAIAAEASHADLRKLQLGGPPPDILVTPLLLRTLAAPDPSRPDDAALVSPPPQTPPRERRWLLPRGSLADAPPSA